jgi:ABC-type Fe3+ transport system permease subunit
MIYECRSLSHFLDALAAGARETENSLWIGFAASVVACLAGVVVGVWVCRRSRPVVHALVIAPLGLPAILLGLAYLRFYNRPWPVDLTVLGNTSALVILALAARSWPFVTRLVCNGRRRIPTQFEEAARLGGLGGIKRWRWITAPLLAEHVAAGAVVAFVLSVGDVEISQLLCAPGTGTLAVRLFTFLHFGPSHVAASLAVLQLAVAVAPVMIYLLITNRCLQIV